MTRDQLRLEIDLAIARLIRSVAPSLGTAPGDYDFVMAVRTGYVEAIMTVIDKWEHPIGEGNENN